MSRRPDEESKSEDPIEVHTADVQPLRESSGETPVAAAPAAPFDPEATLPVADPGRPFDPEVTDKGAFRRAAESPRPPEELVTDPTGRGPRPPATIAPARLFENVPMQPTSGERPLELSQPHPAPSPASEPAFLCVTRGPGQGSSVAVPEGEHPIGRSASCFLCIAHPSVSREHALFKRVGNRFYVRDAASGGGTKINGVRLEGTAEIVPGDQVQIGASVLVLRHGPVVGPEMTDPLGFTAAQQPRKLNGPWLWIAAIATSIASAALASVLLTPLGERLFRGPVRAAPLASTSTMTAPEAPRPTEPAGPDEPVVEPSEVNLDSEIQIKTARREDPPLSAPAPDPALEPVSQGGPGHGSARATPKPRRPLPEPTATLVPPAPKPTTPTTKASEALRLFNEGEVDASINAAKASGSSALSLKLSNFRKEAALAETSCSSGDAMGAVRHLSAAAAIDEGLTRGWSKPGTEVRAELMRLLVELGEKALGAGDAPQAVVLLEKALVYGPGNPKATQLLRDAKARKAGGAPTPAPAPSPAPKDAPADSRKDTRSDADKAFDQ